MGKDAALKLIREGHMVYGAHLMAQIPGRSKSA